MDLDFDKLFEPPAAVKTLATPAPTLLEFAPKVYPETAINPLPDPADIVRTSWFVFDLETVPDETRSPKPEVKAPEPRQPVTCDLADLLTKPITHIRPVLAKLSEQQLTELAAIEGAGKNRSTLLNAIADEVQLLTGCDMSAVEEWKKLSFNPWGCRVVAVGVAQKDAVFAEVAKTIDEERTLLTKLWGFVASCPTRVGYNITAFDDAVLIARSIVLGIPSPRTLDRRKFGNREAADLMTGIFPSGQPMKLKELCKLIGIVPPAGYEMSGDQVLDYVERGDYETVLRYVHSDAIIERELLRKVRDYVDLVN